MPYLPIDPADLGRNYEAVIRVNSQSGKGGFAWVLEQDQGLKLPKKMQADFSRHVQRMADELGRELNAADIWDAFRRAYHVKTHPKHFQLVRYEESRASDGTRIFAGTIAVNGRNKSVSGRGNGLISSVMGTLHEAFGVETGRRRLHRARARRRHRCARGGLSRMPHRRRAHPGLRDSTRTSPPPACARYFRRRMRLSSAPRAKPTPLALV